MFTEEKPDLDELIHYGKLGMKWGRRKGASKYPTGGGGPKKTMITKKRQLAMDKKLLGVLDKGQHLSVGLTKKRQVKYDARDRAYLEKKINSAEVKAKAKAGKPVADYWLKEAGKATLSNIRHPIITGKANRESIATGNLSSQLRRSLGYQNTKDLKDVNRRIDAALKAKRK
jgi:hypothetical protein